MTCTLFILLLSGFTLGLLVRYRREQLAGRERLLLAEVETQEKTYQSVAGELHDNINLSLVLAKMSLATLDPERKTEAVRKQENATRLIDQVMQYLRDLSHGLHPRLLNTMGLVQALETELARLREDSQLIVRFTLDGEPVFLEEEQDLGLLRITQEAFNNILRHAQATEVAIHLAYGEQDLILSITDNGLGRHEPDQETGMGRRQMEKRAALLGGYCRFLFPENGGTLVETSIPYKT
ncbi:MAG: histidine kinase [Candidatus Pseudobacter hemicellulosilyticus]|uniref:histidine kinase n=1 Tax=Candidatus Pseudobacter hemicellulosilyticus TaxID=3121375 RepID=A0AAJ6BG58_9BACT|nr:MAG: histidine kinase [Pseudobacter sp.]